MTLHELLDVHYGADGDTVLGRTLDERADPNRRSGPGEETLLHQAAWFGQPGNGRLLIDAGAPLDIFDSVHKASPFHWAAHGSRYSGAAEERQDAYVKLVEMLLEAGSSLSYPDDPGGNAYRQRLLRDANPRVREVLQRAIAGEV